MARWLVARFPGGEMTGYPFSTSFTHCQATTTYIIRAWLACTAVKQTLLKNDSCFIFVVLLCKFAEGQKNNEWTAINL